MIMIIIIYPIHIILEKKSNLMMKLSQNIKFNINISINKIKFKMKKQINQIQIRNQIINLNDLIKRHQNNLKI